MKKNTLLFLTFSALLCSQLCFAELTLDDLSFKPQDVKVDTQTMQMMEQRHSKLQLHQKWGLATMGAMTATVLISGSAKKSNTHKYAGITTAALYWTTAYFAWAAPKPDGLKDTGSTELHRNLAYIHAPLMAIVPVLGYLAKRDSDKGRESKGIVKAHGGIATAAYIAFMASGLTMYFDF